MPDERTMYTKTRPISDSSAASCSLLHVVPLSHVLMPQGCMSSRRTAEQMKRSLPLNAKRLDGKPNLLSPPPNCA